MATITLKESLRHWMRLFGYFLGVAVVGGAVAGGGLALLEDVPNWAPGGAAPDVGVKLIAGAGLLGVGALVSVAGFFTIVLVVVADGVRFGIDAARDVPDDGDETDDGTSAETVPDPAERVARRRIRRSQLGGQPGGRRTVDHGRTQTTTDPTPQHETDARDSDGEDDEHWMREVERDLAVADEPAAEQPPADTKPTESEAETEPVSQPPKREQAEDGRSAEPPAADVPEKDGDTDTRPATDAPDTTGDADTRSATDFDDTPTDEWVGAGPSDDPDVDDIGGTGVGRADDTQPGSSGDSDQTGAPDDPLAPDDFDPEPAVDESEDSTTVEERSSPDSADSEDEQP